MHRFLNVTYFLCNFLCILNVVSSSGEVVFNACRRLLWQTWDSFGLSRFVSVRFNTFRPRQNCRHFADDIFKRIFLNGNVWISINISLRFVFRGPIDNIPALVQMMASCRPGDKPLSEPMVVSFLTHVCVTRPQWVNHNIRIYLCTLTAIAYGCNAHYR